MSLLDKNKNEFGQMFKDCLGKTGYCEVVTDPKTNKTTRNHQAQPNVEFSKPLEKPMRDGNEDLDDETLAKALYTIINKLDFIIEVLQNRK